MNVTFTRLAARPGPRNPFESVAPSKVLDSTRQQTLAPPTTYAAKFTESSSEKPVNVYNNTSEELLKEIALSLKGGRSQTTKNGTQTDGTEALAVVPDEDVDEAGGRGFDQMEVDTVPLSASREQQRPMNTMNMQPPSDYLSGFHLTAYEDIFDFQAASQSTDDNGENFVANGNADVERKVTSNISDEDPATSFDAPLTPRKTPFKMSPVAPYLKPKGKKKVIDITDPIPRPTEIDPNEAIIAGTSKKLFGGGKKRKNSKAEEPSPKEAKPTLEGKKRKNSKAEEPAPKEAKQTLEGTKSKRSPIESDDKKKAKLVDYPESPTESKRRGSVDDLDALRNREIDGSYKTGRNDYVRRSKNRGVSEADAIAKYNDLRAAKGLATETGPPRGAPKPIELRGDELTLTAGKAFSRFETRLKKELNGKSDELKRSMFNELRAAQGLPVAAPKKNASKGKKKATQPAIDIKGASTSEPSPKPTITETAARRLSDTK